MKITWEQDLQYIITEESHPQNDGYFRKKATGQRDEPYKREKTTSSWMTQLWIVTLNANVSKQSLFLAKDFFKYVG